MLHAFHMTASPVVSRRFGGTIERLTGDGLLVSFNAVRETPDHAARAASAALALQREVERLAAEHGDWPRLRVGVNTGEVVIREMGGDGYVAYELCGDAVNVGARLESSAPVGGVLIGPGTYRELPAGVAVEPRFGLKLKGKDTKVDAYLLRSLS
jgi:class 3 adenylate cyclase